MKNTDLKISELIQEAERLTIQRKTEIEKYNFLQKQQKGKNSQELTFIEMRYIGKIKFTHEQGEEIELEAFISIENIGEELQYIFMAEDLEGNKISLGMKRGERPVVIGIDLLDKKEKEQNNIISELENKWEEREKSPTIKELQQNNKENTEKKEEKENHNEDELEVQQLPGLEKEEKQLTKGQVDRMKGPKTRLSQIVDGETLGNIIGLDGEYMQIVSADEIRRYFPNMQIPSHQITMPICINPDGTAKVIGSDKLEFSSKEGTNSATEHVTATNEGLVRNEQNLETYNITSRGGMHTIAVGYDENGGMPLEMKYGWRHVEEPNKITYSELETVHEGPMGQDDNTNQYKQDASEGIDKPKTISKEDKEKYARAKGLYELDNHGNAIGYDIETAEKEILEDGRDVDEIIEDLDVKTIEPNIPTSRYE